MAVADKLRQASEQPKVSGREHVKQNAGRNDTNRPSGLPMDALETAGKQRDRANNFRAAGGERREEKTQQEQAQPENPQQPNLNAEEAERQARLTEVRQSFGDAAEVEEWFKGFGNFNDNPDAFWDVYQSYQAGRRRGRKSPEHTEFSPREKQFIAMGKIGAKLAELRVTGEDRKEIFERLAENPELTSEVAEILKTIPPGDKTLAEAYMKTAGEEMKRLTEQQKNNPEEAMVKLKWWDLVLLILAGILSVPANAAAEALKP